MNGGNIYRVHQKEIVLLQAAPGGGVTNLKMDIADNDFDDFGSDSSLIWQAKGAFIGH